MGIIESAYETSLVESFRASSSDVYLCLVTLEMMHFFVVLTLTCDRSLNCTLYSNGPDWVKGEDYFEVFSGNCSKTYTNFLEDEVVDKTLFLGHRGQYRVSTEKVAAIHFKNVLFYRMPSDFSIKFPRLTRVTVSKTELFEEEMAMFVDQNSWCCAHHVTGLTLATKINGSLFEGIYGFPNLETLDMSHASVERLEEDVFRAVGRLRDLDLSDNHLGSLPEGVFRPLPNLTHLTLNHNMLRGKDVFTAIRGLKNLKVLKASHNRIKFGVGDLDVFENSSFPLTELNLDYNLLYILSNKSLAPFKHLKTLSLTGNHITFVTNDTFESMVQLREIRLDVNGLGFKQDILELRLNPSLRFLNLSNNRFKDTPFIQSNGLEILNLSGNLIDSDAISTPNCSRCGWLNVKSLNLAHNRMTWIPSGAFQCPSRCNSSVHGTQIQFLNLASNRLDSFSFDNVSAHWLELDLNSNQIRHFGHRPNRALTLRTLDLSRNLLTALESISLPHSLQKVNFSSNKIRVFSFHKNASSGHYEISPNLRIVDLRFNRIRVLCPLLMQPIHAYLGAVILLQENPILCACEIHRIHKKFQSVFKEVDFRREMDNGCSATFGKGPMVHWREETKVRLTCDHPLDWYCQCNVFDSYSSTCDLPCPNSCQCHVDGTFTEYLVDCGNRSLDRVPPLTTPRNLLTILDFSGNRLKSLNSTAFGDSPMVKELHLRNNGLKEIVATSFEGLPNLEVLDLDSNLLEELPESVFANLTKLTELHLSRNVLFHLSGDVFRPLSGLRVLDLRGNSMTCLDGLSILKWTSLSEVRLGNNPWNCDCDAGENFRNWPKAFLKVVVDAEDVTCTSRHILRQIH